MDPDLALKGLRAAVESVEVAEANLLQAQGQEATEAAFSASVAAGVHLATHVREMDEWLSKGGFLPGEWAPRG